MASSKEKIVGLLPIFILVLFFIGASVLVRRYDSLFASLVAQGGFSDLLIYVGITIAAVVIAPISTMPLLPIAVRLWGIIPAALLSVTGWTLGAMIAFGLARRYGAPIVSKFTSIQKLHHLERLIPRQNIFWSVVYLRMIIPVDALSYLLGLFSTIGWRKYSLATLIGVIPFAFIFSYAGSLALEYQLILGGIGIPILAVLYFSRIKSKIKSG